MISKPIAKTVLGNHFVSTVELPGFDEGEIEKYETMVFQVSPGDKWEEKDIQRYLTRREAVVGHVVMVGRWKEILNIKSDVEYCYQCGEPADYTIEDEDIHGNIGDRPICRACRYDMFGKDDE